MEAFKTLSDAQEASHALIQITKKELGSAPKRVITIIDPKSGKKEKNINIATKARTKRRK